MKMNRALIILLALLTGAACAAGALAQGTQLNPPGVRWGSGGTTVPAASQMVGYDSATGLPCIVGSTATCALATSAASAPAGGATAANQVTTNTNLTTINTTLGTPLQTGGAIVASGNVAAGATDSGNPLKVGGVYNSTLPTYTTGQRGDTQVNANGVARITPNLLSATSADGVATSTVGIANQVGQNATGTYPASLSYVYNGTGWDRMRGTTVGTNTIPTAATAGGASFLNIAAGQATTTVKSGAGTLYSIVLNSAATATNTTIIYDNTAGSGTVIGRPAVTTATVPTTLNFGSTGLAFATGLTIVTATANGGDMTIIYK